MRYAWIAALVAVSGCASEPPRPAEHAVSADPVGLDEPPRIEVDGHAAIASARLRSRDRGDELLYVDPEHALHLVRDGVDRVIADEVGGQPVADANETLVAWSEPMSPAGAEIRILRAGGQPATIARASGATSPLAIVGDRVVLVGSENGGVAGVWVATLDGELACVTNCELRAGHPWGDAYVPPPGDPSSIAIEGDRISFVDATGTARTASIAGGTIGGAR